MSLSVLTAGVQIPADEAAPIRFDFELHALRIALVAREHAHRLGEDWRRPGVYILLGGIANGSPTQVYVGQAVDVRGRLLHHRRKPKIDWWRAVVVIRDTTTGFDSAQIGYLEGRLARELRQRPAVEVREGLTNIDTTVPTFARAPLDEFVGTVLEALRIAGLDLRSHADVGEEGEEVGTGRTPTVIPGTVRDLLAAGLISAGTRLFAKRAHREAEAEVSATGELLVDGVAYRSPSTAAQRGLGVRSANGWKAWQTSGGVNLADLRAQLALVGQEVEDSA